MGTVNKLSAKRAASRRYTKNVVIKPVSKRMGRHIMKRDAKIFAALAKCDTSGSKIS